MNAESINFLTALFDGVQYAILIYFFVLNGFYCFLLIAAIKAIHLSYRESTLEDIEQITRSDSLPSITFIVPAYNEELTIEQTVRTLLQLTYRYKQLIVINDGSTDLTLEVLKHHFALVKIQPFFLGDIKTQPVLSYYQSHNYGNLLVIDKVNGGSKADAVNAGINACMTPVFVVMDSDTLIDDEALNCLIHPFLLDSRTIVAGATVRVVNGCVVEGNRIIEYHFPDQFLAGMQCVEYLRAFYLGRMGWGWSRGNLIVSGAFGMFNTKAVLAIGGYDPHSLGEDMEVIIHLHRNQHERNKDYKIVFIPNPIAWTEVPEDWRSLGRQRERWHRGLIQILKKHRIMFLNRRYGLEGLVNFPYYTIGEMFAPIVEFTGYIILIISYFLGLINWTFFWLFLALAWGLTILLSISCILIEEMTFRRYPSFKNLIQMLVYAVIENCGYRQMTVFWRMKAFFRLKKNSRGWMEMKRRGFHR